MSFDLEHGYPKQRKPQQHLSQNWEMQAAQAQHGQLRSFHSRHTCLLSIEGCVCMDWDQMVALDLPARIDAIDHFPRSIALRHAKASLLQLLRSSNLRKLGKEIASWRGFSYKWIPFFKQGMERFCFICIVFLSRIFSERWELSGSKLIYKGVGLPLCSPWWLLTSGTVVF